MFEIDFDPDWDIYYSKLDNSIQIQIWKKIQQLRTLFRARHLKHGLPYFVAEVNQYRIIFTEIDQLRKIMFVGNHKQYEEWTRILDE